MMLDRRTRIAQTSCPVEQAQAEHRLPSAALVLDRERLDLRATPVAQLPHLSDRVRLVGVDPGDLGAPIPAGLLLRLGTGVTSFPAAVTRPPRQHQPNMLLGAVPDPVPVIDPVSELDERHRLTRVAVLELREPDLAPRGSYLSATRSSS